MSGSLERDCPDGHHKRMWMGHFSGKLFWSPTTPYVPPPTTPGQDYKSYAELSGRPVQQTAVSETPVQETPPPQNITPTQNYTSYSDLRNHQYQRVSAQKTDIQSDSIHYQVRGHKISAFYKVQLRASNNDL